MKLCPCCKVMILPKQLKATARLLLQGHGPNSIARQLEVTAYSVHGYINRLFNLTGMDNMLALMLFILRNSYWLYAIYEVQPSGF